MQCCPCDEICIAPMRCLPCLQEDIWACSVLAMNLIARGGESIRAAGKTGPSEMKEIPAIFEAFKASEARSAAGSEAGKASVRILNTLQTPLVAMLGNMLWLEVRSADDVHKVPTMVQALQVLRAAAKELGERCGVSAKVGSERVGRWCKHLAALCIINLGA